MTDIHTSSQQPTAPESILGHEAQRATEQAVLHLLRDPDVLALQDSLKAEIASWPRGQSGTGAERIDQAVLQWTAALIGDELSYARRASPSFVLGTDTTPRRWLGHTFPGTGKAADNPDAIYRSTVLDGRGRYEVTGQIDLAYPIIQILFSISAGTMTHPAEVKQVEGAAPNPDAGIFTILGNLSEDELNIAPDGTFKITIGGEPTGDNHLPTEPVPCSFGCRQMLLDWKTTPLRLTIRRLDTVSRNSLEMAALKQAVLADLGDYVRFWAKFGGVWLGGVKTNDVAPPTVREGGWGFIGGVNFKLAPGEAALITIHPGAAKYVALQVTDPWMVGPDNGRRQSCLNLAQSTPDADGRYTYVISPVDPGVANWLDSCGMDEGFGIMRWQGFPGGASDNSGLFHDFRIAGLSEVAELAGVARITPQLRSKQLAARRDSYFNRFSAA
jgi:hypothetical protein